jgi:hypothetical protein
MIYLGNLAGVLAHGSNILAAFPEFALQWLMASIRRLQLRGQPQIGTVKFVTAFPFNPSTGAEGTKDPVGALAG